MRGMRGECGWGVAKIVEPAIERKVGISELSNPLKK